MNDQNHDTPLGAFEQYMSQVKHAEQLSDTEETQLLVNITTNSASDRERAQQRLIEGYQPFIIGFAKKYAWRCKDLDLLDLIQEGNVGLLQAIKKYDSANDPTAFRAWAFSWIRGMMLQATSQNMGMIRLPVKKVQAIRQMQRIASEWLTVLGREPVIAELAEEMHLSEKEVRELVVLQAQDIVSIHTTLNGDEDITLADIIEAPSTFEDSAMSSIESLIAQLPQRERVVVRLRYGFDGGEPMTHSEIATTLGTSRSMVELLDRRARTRLRAALEEATA